MSIPGKLQVGTDGRVRGAARITYNAPFPCVNGRYGSGAMRGVVMHTMVGTLASANAEFNNPAAQASAHFGVDVDGSIHQWGPIGKGWIAWAQGAGNDDWYSIEHADQGNPNTPLTAAQIAASAQLLEVLSRFAGFPLAEANTPSDRGYGVHYMGGTAWGGHTCPDLPPNHVRSQQRPAIIALAKQIRAGGQPAEVIIPVTFGMQAAAAIDRLEALGLHVTTSPPRNPDHEYTSAGTAPVGGTKVKAGSSVTLNVKIKD